MLPDTNGDEPQRQAQQLLDEWSTHPRWIGSRRDYAARDVIRLRGSIRVQYTLADLAAGRLWDLLQRETPHVAALGAMTGGQAVQMVKAGVEAIT